MSIRLTEVPLLALLLACTSPTNESDEVATDDILFELLDTYYTGDGMEIDVSRDFSEDYADLELRIYADDGTFTSYPADTSVTGEARFAAVPFEPYVLVGRRVYGDQSYLLWREGDARAANLGTPMLGRWNRLYASKPTPIVIDAGGLPPLHVAHPLEDESWDSTQDIIELYSYDAGAQAQIGLDPRTTTITGVPEEGATSFTGLTADWDAVAYSFPTFDAPLLAADEITVAHLGAHHEVDGARTDVWTDYTWWGVDASFSTKHGQADGVSSSLSGTATAGTPGTFELDFPLTAYAATLAGDGAAPSYYFVSFAVVQEPGEEKPMIGVQGTLAQTYVTAYPDEIGDLSTSLSWANPYDRGTPLASATVTATWSFTDALSGTSDRVQAYSQHYALATDLSGTPLAPALDPAANLTVGGASIPPDTTGDGVGLTPEIRFDPVEGAAFYTVVVTDHTDVGPARRLAVARLQTAGTSVTIPDGVLQEGSFYSVQVVASAEGNPLTEEYFFDHATSGATTGPFTP